MTDDARARQRSVAEVIRRYLAGHPAAADTELGITQWWLPALGSDGEVADVRAALDLLEREGVVEACPLDDGRYVWRAATGAGRE